MNSLHIAAPIMAFVVDAFGTVSSFLPQNLDVVSVLQLLEM